MKKKKIRKKRGKIWAYIIINTFPTFFTFFISKATFGFTAAPTIMDITSLKKVHEKNILVSG